MVRCSGKNCREIDVPYVDTIVKKVDKLEKMEINRRSSFNYFVYDKISNTLAFDV